MAISECVMHIPDDLYTSYGNIEMCVVSGVFMCIIFLRKATSSLPKNGNYIDYAMKESMDKFPMIIYTDDAKEEGESLTNLVYERDGVYV